MLDETRPDEKLVEAYKSGENDAFDRLVERYQPRLIGFAFKILKNIHDVEDAVQETWSQAWQNLPLLESTRSFSSWLYKICKSQCFMQLRRKKVVQYKPLTSDIEYQQLAKFQSALHDIPDEQIQELKTKCLGSLEPKERLLYYLKMEQGLPYKEITQQPDFQDISEEALRQRFTALRKKVRNQINQYFSRMKKRKLKRFGIPK